ncbi:acyltransferase family protein, partial [uncultured Mucilaginibacter sp.]|uniref:acyltransferase family protein n=1 Tax=uncultured Mucilaginibacter sp. TaxID=797541 RepID=UPI0025DEEE74
HPEIATTKMPLKRDYAVDNLKGVIIILVIIGHNNLLNSFKNPFTDFLQGYIYLFHMPLFFGVSALFVRDFSWEYVKKRFIQLMLPFFFFAIIDPVNIIFQLVHPGSSAIPLLLDFHFKDAIKKIFVGSGFYLQSPLWFLPTLFLANLLFALLFKNRLNKLLIGIYLVVFCLVLFFAGIIQTKHYLVSYGIDAAIYVIPLLFIMHFVYINKPRFLKYNPLIYLGGIIACSILILLVIPKRPLAALTGRFDIAQFYVPNTLWGYLLICALSVSIFLLFLRFNRRTIFSTIGLYTMPIFILHIYPWFNGLKALSPVLFLLLNIIGALAIAIGLSKLLMKISPKFRWIGMVA